MTKHPPIVRHWLTFSILLVAAMVLIGGATRLTESGLSIVEWKLVAGTLPPLNAESWDREFAEYQTSPQFRQVNRGFTLADFKRIYWLEYLHRLMGRITGLVLLLPFLGFAIRKQLSPAFTKRMAVAVVLVALQGAVGWIMVASGLIDQPRVAPVKLALHLALAFALFGYLLWLRWQLDKAPRLSRDAALASGATLLCVLLAIQIVFGALVAGLDAGLSYTTYPLMDGRFIPDGLYLLEPWWKNHLESVLTVQFQHRMGALAVAAGALALAAYGWRRQRRMMQLLLATVFAQFTLGITTLVYGVPLFLALAHQGAALLLLAVVLRLIYINRPNNSRNRRTVR